MNTTDKGSILIIFLFYVLTLTCGYFIHKNQLVHKNDVTRLILTINSSDINTENNSAIVYEDIGEPQPIQKVYAAGSIVAISSIYEQKGYELVHISEFLKKIHRSRGDRHPNLVYKKKLSGLLSSKYHSLFSHCFFSVFALQGDKRHE